MLKGENRFWLGFSTFLIIIGVILCGIGFALDQEMTCIQEQGYHKWYQIIYRDTDGALNIGLNFDDAFAIGHVKMELQNKDDIIRDSLFSS